MTATLANPGLTVWPTVLATLVPKNTKAMKLKNAAHSTASRGRSTPVATMVEIELAESWKPLV
jgi:hypothetical protein